MELNRADENPLLPPCNIPPASCPLSLPFLSLSFATHSSSPAPYEQLSPGGGGGDPRRRRAGGAGRGGGAPPHCGLARAGVVCLVPRPSRPRFSTLRAEQRLLHLADHRGRSRESCRRRPHLLPRGPAELELALEELALLAAGERPSDPGKHPQDRPGPLAEVAGLQPPPPPPAQDPELLSVIRQKDLVLAALVGKALLERNQDMSRQYEQMHKELTDKLEMRTSLGGWVEGGEGTGTRLPAHGSFGSHSPTSPHLTPSLLILPRRKPPGREVEWGLWIIRRGHSWNPPNFPTLLSKWVHAGLQPPWAVLYSNWNKRNVN
ncbi:uncharacterized protein [Delphinus delphis]|uniref:uncharacterized protein n=1 Tax=Delphinus delphis TaxID=9728 RepID=UPI0028C38CA4|nr:uncharacterized protein LOC132435887 [Delphinus delphis]